MQSKRSTHQGHPVRIVNTNELASQIASQLFKRFVALLIVLAIIGGLIGAGITWWNDMQAGVDLATRNILYRSCLEAGLGVQYCESEYPDR